VSIASGSASAEIGGPTDAHRRPPRTRHRLIAGVVVTVLVAAGATLAVTNPFGGGGPAKAAVADSADPTSLAMVTQRPLSSQIEVNATLGYASSYTVMNQASGAVVSSSAATRPGGGQTSGTFTALPEVGEVVSQGQSLYAVDGAPVLLLYGSTPAYRSLSEGMAGTDVTELNADLVTLQYATSSQLSPTSDYFSSETAYALEKLQAALGIQQTGNLPLGQAVFLPTAARVTEVSATLGGPAQVGAPVLQATSTTRQVIVNLDAAQQSEVKVGNQVTITLPDNQTTPGVVSSVATVATCPPSPGSPTSSGAGSSGSDTCSSGSSVTPTIAVDVTPSDPAATGNLDQAPVLVSITTASVKSALVVPVDALLAESGGGYAVEVAGAAGTRHLVPVSLGLFDDADGLVAVTGSGLAAGQRVVVPSL
jgi:hypothetical protein